MNHNGAAEYHLPFWVPDGRGGLQPELAIYYNSQSGNGLLGVGWSLSAGLSSITPCARTLAQDGVVDNPHFYTAEDVYCLNGERLRAIDPPASPERNFRSERDMLARIRSYSQPPRDDSRGYPPDYFKVWTKDGRTLTFDTVLRAYGLSKRSDQEEEVENPSFQTSVDTNARGEDRFRVAWALSKIEDRNGNTVQIEYETVEDEANQWSVEMVPRAIIYGPDRRLEFLYEDRPDKVNHFLPGDRQHFFGGVHTELGRRLKTIRVLAGTELLREYRLDYQDEFASATRRSRLARLTECDGGTPAVCFSPLEFEWSGGPTLNYQIIDTEVTDVAVATHKSRFYMPGDVNGDGRDDLIYRGDEDNSWKVRFSNGESFGEPQELGIPRVSDDYDPRVRPIDFDRDGRLDLMVEVPAGDEEFTQFRLYRSTEAGYEQIFGDRPIFHRIQDGRFVEGLWHGYFADIDGNGLPDYLSAVLENVPEEADVRLHWLQRLNLGSEFARLETIGNTVAPLFSMTDSTPFDYQIRAASLDGRRTEPIFWHRNPDFSPPTGHTSYLSFSGSLNLPFLREPENTDRRNLHFVDVNGDGLDDAVYPCTGMQVQLSSGAAFSEFLDGPSAYEPCPLVADDNLRVRMVDVTGDGNDDIVLIHSGTPEISTDFRQGVQVYTWTGRRFTRLATGIGTNPGLGWILPLAGIQPLDFNGDGLMDFAQVWSTTQDSTTRFIRVRKRQGGLPDKLTRVNVAGLGARVEVDYTSLADSSVHLPATDNCTYPIICPRRGGSIVAAHRLANGMTVGSAWRQFRHTYKGARVDLRGHGWLGFEQHDVRDEERTNAVTTALLDNHNTVQVPIGDGVTAYAYPFAGQPYKTTYSVTSGAIDGAPVSYEHTVNKGLRSHLGTVPGTWVQRLENVTVSDRERVGTGAWMELHSRTTTFDEYDEFENVKKFTTVVPGSDRVVELTYRNDTTEWLIGLPTTRVENSCTRPDNDCQTRRVSFDYHPNGNLRETVVEPDDDELLLRTTVAYGNFGNVSSVIHADTAGETRTTSYTYDSLDLYPRTTTNAVGHTTSVNVHPGLGVLLDSQDANGVTPVTMKYDRFGRVREVRQADGYFEHYGTEGVLNHLTTVPDGTGVNRIRERAMLGRLGRTVQLTLLDEHESTTFTEYDRLGRIARTSRPVAKGAPVHFTTYAYDDRDRRLTAVAPDGVTIRHSYRGRLTHTDDGRNIHSFIAERADGQLGSRSEDDPKSEGWLETRFDYGPFGLPRKVTAADGTSQTMTYDRRGRRTQHVDPSMGITTWSYNAFGELRRETDGTGAETTIQIGDLLGRPTRIASPDGVTEYGWDGPRGIGKLDVATQVDTNGHYIVNHFSYDEIGRQVRTSWHIDKETDDEAFFELSIQFDTIGRLRTITYPRVLNEVSPLQVDYTYSPIGHLQRVTDTASGALYWQADSHAPDGQVTLETYGNGLIGERVYLPETGLLETLTTGRPGAPLDQIRYGYDDNRNVITRNDLVGEGARSQSYTYDSLDRLATWSHSRSDGSDPVTTTFDYDAIGNLRSEAITGRTGRNVLYQYGERGAPLHAVTSRNGQRYTYDGAGRRTAGAALTSITYNRRNLPLLIQRSSGGPFEFAYDAAGTRVLRRTGDSTRFSIGGLFERTIGNRVSNHHDIVADGRAVAQVVMTQDTPEGPVTSTDVRYLHTDVQGSTVLATGPAGTVLSELFYDPFGRRADRNYNPLNSQVTIRPGYTGHHHDEELDLIDMNGRVYDQETRRFLTPDPFVQAPLFSQSHNRYSYVWNNPPTFIDPTGFECEENPHGCDKGSIIVDDDNWEDAINEGVDFAENAAKNAAKAAGQLDDPISDLFCGIFSCGSPEKTPASDDNNPTDIISTGSGVRVASDDTLFLGLTPIKSEVDPNEGANDFISTIESTVDIARSAARDHHMEEMVRNAWFGVGGLRVRGPIRLQPYSEGRGHHVPAKSLFRKGGGWAKGYDPNAALAISKKELERQKIIHPIVSGAQHTLYGELARMGVQRIPWTAIERIEIAALVKGGASPAAARAAVVRVIEAMKKAGIEPTHIPWGY